MKNQKKSMEEALWAIANMQIQESTNPEEVLTLCISIARIELEKWKKVEKVKSSITEQSLSVFIRYAKDSLNWGGTPMVDGDAAERGNLTQLKKANLIKTFESDGCQFINFLPAGIELARKHGIEFLHSNYFFIE